MSDIKEKKSLNKVKKQVIFADEVSRTFYRKIEITTLVDHLKSCDAVLKPCLESNHTAAR